MKRTLRTWAEPAAYAAVLGVVAVAWALLARPG
jgi:hypothetical protein